MSAQNLIEYRRIIGFRCFQATASSIVVQFVLLTIFLLFINFNLLHPLIWLKQTIHLMFSFYTWLLIMPLLCSVLCYGFLLGKTHLAARIYCPNRLSWFLANAISKLLFLCLHVTIGFLTAWMYVRYLHADYRYFVTKCFGIDCLNSRYLFLINAGIFASCYYFAKEKLYAEQPPITFSHVYFHKIMHLRNVLYKGVGSSFRHSIRPMVYFIIFYMLFKVFLNNKLNEMFALETDDKMNKFFVIIFDWRLLYYTLLLFSQILSNFHIMQKYFIIFLTYKYEFPIERKAATYLNETIDVTLANALSLKKIPLIQNLAACDLYDLSTNSFGIRRCELFSLSIPGGHPNNWLDISKECLAVLNEYIIELKSTFENIKQLNSIAKPTGSNIKPFVNERAERLLIRQYNELKGIRNLVTEENLNVYNNKTKPNQNYGVPKNSFNRNLQIKFQTMKKKMTSIKLYAYLLQENDSAKTSFVLENSKPVSIIIRALGGFCAASLNEDKFGVVQCTLTDIITTLLHLKSALDELNNVTINGTKIDKNYIVLKNVVKRTLTRITNKFKEHIPHIIAEPKDIQQLFGLIEIY